MNTVVKDKEEFTIADNLEVKCVFLCISGLLQTVLTISRCLATPCHTQDSICFYIKDKSDPSQPGVVFTGDTLFQGGCGRFFEGSADQMHKALFYLGTLPDSTVVYNGHEYTKSNLLFGESIEPESPGMKALRDLVQNNSITCGKSTIGDEKQWNVFMRLTSERVL